MTVHRQAPSRRRTLARAALAGALVLGFGLASVPAATATPAGQLDAANSRAAGGPRLVSVHQRGRGTAPLQYRYNIARPALRGASRANQRRLDRAINQVVRAELMMIKRWRQGIHGIRCHAASLNATWGSRTILAGRYVNPVMLMTSNPGCEGVNQDDARSVMLDLATAQILSVGDFVNVAGGVADEDLGWNIIDALQDGTCTYSSLTPSELPALRNWSASAAGITFWFDRYQVACGAGGIRSATIGWESIPLTSRGAELAAAIRG